MRRFFIVLSTSVLCCVMSSARCVEEANPIPDNAINLPLLARPAAAPLSVLIPQPPAIDAQGYILMDVATGNIIAQHQGEQRMEPASLTKLMSTYIVFSTLQNNTINLEDEVRVSETAWRAEGSRMFIKQGDRVKVSDLIQGDIVASGNDATIALSEYIAGSEVPFVEMMNAAAQNLGMTNSHFVDATGLPAEDHYTTPADLAKLARAIILQFPDQYHWFSEKWFLYAGIKQPNRNRLLWQYPGTDGLKTGHTNAAGYCLIASAVKDNTRLLVVVMGAPSDSARAADAIKLFTYGFRFFQNTQLYAAQATLTSARVWGAEHKEVPLGLLAPLSVTLPVGADKLVHTTLQVSPNLVAPLVKGQVCGEVHVVYQDRVIATAPLVALEDNAQGGMLRRCLDYLSKIWHKLFGGAA